MFINSDTNNRMWDVPSS